MREPNLHQKRRYLSTFQCISSTSTVPQKTIIYYAHYCRMLTRGTPPDKITGKMALMSWVSSGPNASGILNLCPPFGRCKPNHGDTHIVLPRREICQMVVPPMRTFDGIVFHAGQDVRACPMDRLRDTTVFRFVGASSDHAETSGSCLIRQQPRARLLLQPMGYGAPPQLMAGHKGCRRPARCFPCA